jgi:hypothetical protein
MTMINNHVSNERRQVAIFLLTILKAILNEQERARIIDKDTADYIYSAVKDQAQKLGYIE